MKTNRFTFNHTIYASFTGFIVQAIVNNFIPLLFLTFTRQYDIPLTLITLLVAVNFGVQFLVDFVAAFYVDRIGYKAGVVMAHLFVFAGLMTLAVLPVRMDQPFIGLILSVIIYAIGGGLLEVLLSPIVEASPTDHKESAMSLLHSFYCWGHVGVVVISSLYFLIIGIEHWQGLALFWSLIPLLNGLFFTQVPIRHVLADHHKQYSFKQLLNNRVFLIMALLMVGAGASEQAVSQWMSAFTETSLGISKSFSDLTGPMIFALAMGLSRLLYGKYGKHISIKKFMTGSAVLCFISYLVIAFSPWMALSLIGCALTGMSVGIMWPGIFSLSAKEIPRGGTMMFAFLALAGDIGCAVGPAVVGFTAGRADNTLQTGILYAAVFPLVLLVGLYINSRRQAESAIGVSETS